MKKYFLNVGSDLPAAVVVFLVALPLCLGIALGSGAPLFSGIIAGIVGGIIVGIFSGSPLSVSGPAAGLTVIVASAILKLQEYDTFLLAVMISGILQYSLGLLKAGVIGDFVPNAVIKGMLAAIGLILILKQLPHLVGFDADYLGDESFLQQDQKNTFSDIINSFNYLTPAAVIIGVVSLSILTIWEAPFFKSRAFFKYIPGPLVVVIVSVIIAQFLSNKGMLLEQKHMVSLPVAEDMKMFFSFFTLPDFGAFTNKGVWVTAFTLAIVASLETLLAIEAVDKLDPLKRVTPTNKELKAQGIGNMISGLIGGLPLTSVIVRSSANVMAGGKTKTSAIFHGILLLISVIWIPHILNLIPLSSLAAILIFTGYKLTKLPLFKHFYHKGLDQFIPFVVTITAILFTDLLTGIIIGVAVGLFFLIRSNFQSSIIVVADDNRYLIRFRKDVSFLNKPIIKKKLEEIPENSFLILDVTRADFIDKDIIEEINNFFEHAHLKNIVSEINRNEARPMHLLINLPARKI